MRVLPWLMAGVLAGVVTGLLGAAQAATSGSYSSQAVGPTVHATGQWYSTSFPVVGDPPANGRIQQVGWEWDVATRRPGLEVRLCYRHAQDCVDITAQGRGKTPAFAGRAADGGFVMMFRVTGGGRMAPLQGARNRVTVEYAY